MGEEGERVGEEEQAGVFLPDAVLRCEGEEGENEAMLGDENAEMMARTGEEGGRGKTGGGEEGGEEILRGGEEGAGKRGRAGGERGAQREAEAEAGEEGTGGCLEVGDVAAVVLTGRG